MRKFRHLHLERSLAVLDLETTGVQVRADRIVQVAALKFAPHREPVLFTRTVNTGVPVPAAATAVHGLTDAELADCPPFTRMARKLARFLDHCDLAGYGIKRFDLAVLCAEFRRAVRSGRRQVGQEKGADVLAPRAQQRHGFVVGSLPRHSTLEGNVWDEAVIDNTQSAVPDQVCFRLDFPAWRRTRTERDRRLLDDLMRGEPTLSAAQRHGLSAARVSQLRRDFLEDWERFGAAPEEAPHPSSVV